MDLHSHDLILSAGITWCYKAAVIVAALLGGAIVRHDSRAWPVTARVRFTLLAVVGLGSLIGCAIPAFFAGGTIAELTTSSLLAPKTILGSLLFGFLAAAAFKKLTRNEVDTSDAFARGAIAMMFIGRLGCVAKHCCYGAVTDLAWGMNFGDGRMRVPVQIVEAAGLLVLAGLVQWLHVADRFRGRRLFVLFSAYGLLRFGLEFLRAPVAQAHWGIGFYQWIAIALMAVGLCQIFKRTRARSPSAGRTPQLEVRT